MRARPGLIVFIGVIGIALAVVVVMLIPPPSVDRELNSYIPRGATEQNRSREQTMSAVALTTTQDVAGVLDFYGRKFKLRQNLTARGGMTTMTRGRIFGGHYSDAIMPLSGSTGEAITITHRESRQIVVIAVSRATNEPLTYLTVLLERLPFSRQQGYSMPNLDLVFGWPPPPGGKAGSSGTGVGVGVAEFSTVAPFEQVAGYYSSKAGPYLLLEQKRESGESAFLATMRRTRESFYIFCFKDNASTQTHVSVNWVAE